MNTAKIWRVDRPQDEPLLVALDRLRQCPEELTDEFWPPAKGKPSQKPLKKSPTSETTDCSREATQVPVADHGLVEETGTDIPGVSQDGTDVSPVSARAPEREPGKWTGRLRRNPRKKNQSDEVV